jgi:hypothetical protein
MIATPYAPIASMIGTPCIWTYRKFNTPSRGFSTTACQMS